jgi:Concanavalin A-like lectin/glucanases superfamily
MLEERKLLTSIVVNTLSDPMTFRHGFTSLRQAVQAANNNSSTPTIITFSPAVFSTHKTITLLQGELTLNNTKEPTTIIGPEPGITISAHHNSNVFSGGVFFVSAKNVKVALSKMTITGGFGHGDEVTTDGGGIYNEGTMMLTNVTVSGNSAQSDGEPCLGGGIYNQGGTMVLTNSTVSGNSLSGTPDEGSFGGGIYNSGGMMTLKNVIVSGNSSDFDGGGIDNSGGTMTLMNSTVSGNSGGGGGGGIENGGKMTLTDSTVSGNTVGGAFRYSYTYGYGGGIDNGGTLTLTNSTVSGNSAGSGGGGIENDAKMTLTLTNSTVSGNSADTGGGIDNDSGTVKPANSIIAGNTGGSSDPDVSGPITSLGHNLIGKTNGSTGWIATDLTGNITHPLNANLGALGSNGGPTKTLLPQTGSPAINAGSNALIPSGITTDQRGLPRISGGTVDIGAVEVPQTLISGTVFFDANKNGTKETSEAGLAGWKVYDDANNNGKFDSTEPFTFTNSTGAYALALSGTGTANIRQVLPANWSQTAPSSNGAIKITLSPGAAFSGKNIGDFTSIKYLKTVATTTGIVAWWTFDSSSQANSILNGYTGTLQGSAKISAAGKGAPITGEQSNTALVLNGTSSKVTTNLTTQQEFTTAATYNVWINLGSTPAKSGHIYEILAKSQFGNDLDLQVETDGSVHFYTDTGSSTSFKPASLTGWHMVTAEFDMGAKTRKIFWDGKQVASSTPGAHSASTQAFTIGASGVFAGRFFDGSIDEASLWNRALIATEVTAIFNASSGH